MVLELPEDQRAEHRCPLPIFVFDSNSKNPGVRKILYALHLRGDRVMFWVTSCVLRRYLHNMGDSHHKILMTLARACPINVQDVHLGNLNGAVVLIIWMIVITLP